MNDSILMKAREANALVQVLAGVQGIRDLVRKEKETYDSALDVLQAYFKSETKEDDLKTTSSITSDTGKVRVG